MDSDSVWDFGRIREASTEENQGKASEGSDMTRGVPLRDDEKAKIQAEINQKFPSQIASELGRSIYTVKNFLRRERDDSSLQ